MRQGLHFRGQTWTIALVACCLLFAFSPLSGCGDSGPRKKQIILLNNTESPFWDAARAGIKDAVKQLKLEEAGYTASMDNNDGTGKGQVDKLKQYATRDDIVAVGISPIDAQNESMAEQLKKLKDKGVIIICFDSDLPADKQNLRDFYIGTDNIKGGKVLGTAAKILKPEGASYVQFVGTDTQQNAIERMNGFKESVGDKYEEKERKLDGGKRDVAKANVRQAVVKYPDLGMLVGIWSYNAPAIADVVAEPEKRSKYAVVTFDAEENAITHMAQGNIDVMVVQNPFAIGYQTVQTAFAKLTKDEKTIKEMFPKLGEPGGDIKDTGLKVVVPTENTPLKKEQFETVDPTVEFLTLPEFQTWLKKYGLTSS